MKIGLIGSGQMGNRVEEVAQERGDTVLLLRTAPKEATTLAFTELPELLIDFSHPDNLEKIISTSVSHWHDRLYTITVPRNKRTCQTCTCDV